MRVVHKNKIIDKNVEHRPQEFLELAKEAELAEDFPGAAELYQQVIKEDSLNEFAYNRLMIIYRREKEYAKEVKVIDKAIKAFEKHYASTTKHNRTITSISEKLNKAFGLTDKKGQQVYEPEPIAKWRKRKIIAEKKIK